MVLNANSPFKDKSSWVEDQLAGLTLEQKVGQLLHVRLDPAENSQTPGGLFDGVEPGGVFMTPGTKAQIKHAAAAVQEQLSTPALVSSDLENGAGRMMTDATQFPDLMGVAATGNVRYAYELGRAAAVEGKECGIHWSLGPVVDINAHPHNPVINTRSFGDDPAEVSSYALQLIRGMQDQAFCATAKHFPGAGYDDRDPHVCTIMNPLSTENWPKLSGCVFKDAVSAGVWSVMVGHIALPAIDPGVNGAPPATLSHRITTGLLREELQFEGVIISDAMDMAGVTSWGSREEILITAVEAGCDQLLFANTGRDYDILVQAVREGRLSEERIDQSVRRILRLKQLVGLAHYAAAAGVEIQGEKSEFARLSREICEASVTLVRDRKNTLPLPLTGKERILSCHLCADAGGDVDTWHTLLEERSSEVVRIEDPVQDPLPTAEQMEEFDAVVISLFLGPRSGINCIRPDSAALESLTKLLNSGHRRIAVVSFGSPYHLYDFPEIDCLINAYSPYFPVQKAAVHLLAGDIEAVGRTPVDLQRPEAVERNGILGITGDAAVQ